MLPSEHQFPRQSRAWSNRQAREREEDDCCNASAE